MCARFRIILLPPHSFTPVPYDRYQSLCGRDEAGAGREDGPEMESTTHHAPRFVDEVTVGATDDTVNSPESFIAGPEYAPLASSSTSKSKQKQQSKASKRRIEVIAGQMSAHLSEHGWAVCDSFLPLDLVRRVRIETEIFKEFFEQSEIWGMFDAYLNDFKLFS